MKCAKRWLTLGLGLFALNMGTSASAAPDEAALGKGAGYPLGDRRSWFYDETVRVGSFSNLDKIMPNYNRMSRAARPSRLARAVPAPDLKYRFRGTVYSPRQFLAHQRTTGLLLIRDGTILFEAYQYDRTERHRFVSQSMAKSVVSLAIGFALADGKIKSLGDTVATYVPGLRECRFGSVRLRALLHMASGIALSERYDRADDLSAFIRLRNRQGVVRALCAYGKRSAPEGTRFAYASPQTVALGVVLRHATGQSISEYLSTRLWQPMGAEADAIWITDRGGFETAGGGLNAVLRDYGRLGVLLANDGALNGKQIIPRDYLLAATDPARHAEPFKPRKATRYYGYGYQFWTLPGRNRQFALFGVYGQRMLVDPKLKLVLVHTGVAKKAVIAGTPMGAEIMALWRGLVAYADGRPVMTP